MINLIPAEEKKRMTRAFYMRLITLFFLTASFIVFLACGAILPAYFMSSVKESIINTKLKTAQSEPLPQIGEQSLSIIKDLNTKLALVDNAEQTKFLPSEKVINAILLKKNPEIKITQILYESDQNQLKKITILGIAPSREVLLLFRQSLEDDGSFKNVVLPISNFVKTSNIQFNLNLSPV